MNKFHVFLAMGAGLALTASAASADGYSGGLKDSVPYVADASWAGFYLGMHGGWGWKNDDFSTFVGTDITNQPRNIGGIDSQGSVWGGQAGYNWQYGHVVTGLELDFSSSNMDGNAAPVTFDVPNFGIATTTTREASDDVRYLGTARARLGFTPGGYSFYGTNFLFYGTAGLAWERVDEATTTINVNVNNTSTQTITTPSNLFGWVVGAGAEAQLCNSSHWIARIEYLHYDFGDSRNSNSVINTNPALADSTSTAGSQRIDLVRGALSYKF